MDIDAQNEKYINDRLKALSESPLYQHVLFEDLMEVSMAIQCAEDEIDDPYTDNFRVFLTSMRKEYNKLRDAGCCGSVDSSIKAPSGTTYLYGFNYGH